MNNILHYCVASYSCVVLPLRILDLFFWDQEECNHMENHTASQVFFSPKL